jgi:hypothetical protein
MRKTCLSNLHYLLLVLLLMAITGCGANNRAVTADNGSGSGSITAKLVVATQGAKSTAKALALTALPSPITSLQFTITGTDSSGKAIPVVRNTVTSTDDQGKAQITGIYPGNVTVAVKAFANTTLKYEGFAINVSVVAGPTASDAGTIVLSPPLTKPQDANCVACHETTLDSTGQNLVADFKQSGHYENQDWTANPRVDGAVITTGSGCAGCHGPAHNDSDPSASGRCFECHGPMLSVTHAQRDFPANSTKCTLCHQAHDTTSIVPQSALNASGHGDVASPAWAVSSSHNWGQSGSTLNFQTSIPANDCVRCHTADGFVQFTASGYSNIKNLPGTTLSNPALKCTGCHNSDLSVRTTGAVATFYNVSTVDKVTKKTVKSHIGAKFPDVGQSNLCISCHSGRLIGPNLTEMFNTGNWDLSNTGFQNSHYMAAAGTMYNTVGFKNFTGLNSPVATNFENGPRTYAPATKTYNTYNTTALTGKGGTGPGSFGIAGGVTSAHKALGTPSNASAEDYLLPPTSQTAMTTNGPCVTCHMKAYEAVAGNGFTPPAAGRPGVGHSLKIDEATAQELCLECHADAPHLDGGDGAGNAKYTNMTNLADMEKAMLEPQSECFQNGLTLVKKILAIRYMINYDPNAYPYFYDMKTGAAMADWTRAAIPGVSGYSAAATAAGLTPLTGALTQVQAYRLMGACYNLNVLAKDPGSYVHARTYTQRVVYDTVDYLDNNLMDFTALTTARAMTAAGVSGLAGIYVGNNVNVHASDGTLATESMIWLSGTHYNDTNAGNTYSPMKLHP